MQLAKQSPGAAATAASRANVDLKADSPKTTPSGRRPQAPRIRVQRRTDGRIERFAVLVDFGSGEPSLLGLFSEIDDALADAGRARVAWQAKALILEPGVSA